MIYLNIIGIKSVKMSIYPIEIKSFLLKRRFFSYADQVRQVYLDAQIYEKNVTN